MEEVKTFLEDFFQSELDTYNAQLFPDLDAYNQKVEQMYAFCDDAWNWT